MLENKKTGKLIGSLFLLQMAAGIFLNFFLLGKITKDPLSLASQPEYALILGAGTIIALVISGFNLVVAGLCYPHFRTSNPVHSLAVVVLAGIGLALTAVEYAHVMELYTWSKNFTAATSEDAKSFLESLRPLVVAGRNAAHFMAIGISGFGLMMLYLLFYRAASTPRLLAGFGAGAAALQVIAVSHTFFGLAIPFLFLLPLMVAQLVLPVWFIVKGIGVRPGSAPAAN